MLMEEKKGFGYSQQIEVHGKNYPIHKLMVFALET